MMIIDSGIFWATPYLMADVNLTDMNAYKL